MVVNTYRYTDYGTPTVAAPSPYATYYGYNGEEHDALTGPQYLRARYYNSRNGNFISQDTYTGTLDNPLSQNRYTYTENNPVNFADPSGHSIWSSIKNGVGKAVNAVKNVATNVANAIKSTVSTVTNAVKNTVSTIKNAFAPKPSAPTHRYTSPPTPAWNAGQTQTNIFHGAAQTPAQNPTYTVKTIGGKPTLVPAHFDNPTAAATSFVKERGCDPSKAKAAKQNEESWFTSLSKNVGKWWQENQQAITVGVMGIAIGGMAVATVLSAGAAAPLLAATIATTLGTTAATGATIATLALAGVATAGGASIATGAMSIGSTIPSENNVLKPVVNSPTFQVVQGGSILVSTLGTAALAPYAQMGQQAKQEQAATNSTKPAAGQTGEGGVKTDFYVTPSGTAVPSTGQRYFARNPELLQSAKDGVLPARSNGMYFSFDKIDDAIIAQGKLQIPYKPEYRVSFDTLQIIDDIKIPKGDWGRSSYLKPLTKDFMQYGPGKATQVITNSPVNVSDIYKLR